MDSLDSSQKIENGEFLSPLLRQLALSEGSGSQDLEIFCGRFLSLWVCLLFLVCLWTRHSNTDNILKKEVGHGDR